VGCGVSHGNPSFCKAVLSASRTRRCMKGGWGRGCLRWSWHSRKSMKNDLFNEILYAERVGFAVTTVERSWC
jgi:hypothetical protein